MFLKLLKKCIETAINEPKWKRTARQLGAETVELNKALKIERAKVVKLELAAIAESEEHPLH